MTGFTIVILYLTRPVELLLAWQPELARAEIAVARLEALGFQLHAAPPTQPEVPSTSQFQTLQLRGIRYTYPESEGRSFSLGPIDLKLRAGETIFLAGGNGAGKTTFAKLLTGLYEPEEGEIQINGSAVGAERRRAYRQHFTAIYSDSYLFPELLGEAGSDGLTRSLIERLQLAHRVTVERGFFSTVALSQGERKRLMLLVALLEDRPICVFDEWAADQDPRFRNTFYTEILPELRARGKAVFVITHDDRYFMLADRLLKLEDGRLVDEPARAGRLSSTRDVGEHDNRSIGLNLHRR